MTTKSTFRHSAHQCHWLECTRAPCEELELPKSVESGNLGVNKPSSGRCTEQLCFGADVPKNSVLDARRRSCAMQGHGRRGSRTERGAARLVTTRAMNACQRPCFPFWRIACLVLSFARQTVTYSPLSKPQTRPSFARGKCRRASRTRGNSLRPRLPHSTDFGNSNSSHGALVHSSQ